MIGNTMSEKVITFRFEHGLGDCANFAHALPLWTSRGYTVRVQTTPDKAPLFTAAGCELVGGVEAHHEYYHPPGPGAPLMRDDWSGNKVAWNLIEPPLPRIGSYQELWPELLGVKLSLKKQLSKKSKGEIDAFLSSVGRPLVVLHTRGNTSPGSKNFPAHVETDLYRKLLENTDADLLLLDFDNRVTRMRHSRVWHLTDDFRRVNLPELWYLLDRAAVLVGVDSGPLHFCRTTDTPAVGVWFHHHPARFALPRANTVHVSPPSFREWNWKRRHSFNVVEADTNRADPLALVVGKLLAGKSAPEVVLDHCADKLRTDSGGEYRDRDRTFRRVVARLKTFKSPVLVETGCARAVEDWSAGFSTYFLGLFLKGHGAGELHSVDLSPGNCAFAREWAEPFPVTVHESDSVAWLQTYAGRPIDFLYLDSLDTTEPGHADHCVNEFRAAEGKLADDPLVLIDDTVRVPGGWWGKGAKLVPLMLAEGWRVESAGYGVLLRKGAA